MKLTFSSLAFLAALLWGVFLQGQSSCVYTLELFDSGGDGWNGAFITLTIDGAPSTYTLNGEDDNGSFRSFEVTLSDGAAVSLVYTRGVADFENSYVVFGPDGNFLLGDGPTPMEGEIFSGPLACPSCVAPDRRRVSIDDVRAFRADVSWQPAAPGSRYVVEFGLAGFIQGTGEKVETSDNAVRIQNLQEKTRYDFYLFAVCEAGDTSVIQGPFNFETLWSIDVGISGIYRPFSSCDLEAIDTVGVLITNYGGNPQSLIPFFYAVNGVPAPVNFPFDGLYTGVVGKDSTADVDFEATYDFSVPGEYVITAWTEMENDREPANDTTTVTITSIPTIASFPYFEDFEVWGGGWTIDSFSSNPSWAYGIPEGTVINSAAGGDFAWVTNLDGLYNDDELSYLLSPCLDFSSLSQDPRFSFSLFLQTEECCDGLWLEVSTDGGATWSKVGTAGTGLNWYNDAEENRWAGDNSDQGWVYAFNTLTGTAGKPDVRIRFVFSSDNTVRREGIGIDNIFISTPLANDLAAVQAVNVVTDECGSTEDKVTLTIGNFGTRPQSGFNVGYRVNDGPVVSENVGGLTVAPNGEATFTFSTLFNSSEAGRFVITAWTALQSDEFRNNDTTRFILTTVRELPFSEDFEAVPLGGIPEGWEAPGASVSSGHGNISKVLAFNLNAQNSRFEATLPALGPVVADDSLTFDYRLVNRPGNGSTPKILVPGEKLEVQISTDCGENYVTVLTRDETNHTPSAELATLIVPLEAFAGQHIKIRYVVTWAAGDFWFDLDNVNIQRCPASLQLNATVVNESASGAADGSATVAPGGGTEPFEYFWSTGDTTKTAEGLSAGTYTVAVTDRYGCSDVLEVEVGVGTSVRDLDKIEAITLSPNPSSGRSLLQVTFSETVEAEVQVFNLVGQPLGGTALQRTNRLEHEIDLASYPAGVYFIRLRVGSQVRTEKLIRIE